MVNNHHRLDDVFAALSDPTRREMIRRLSRGTLSVSELAAPLQMSLPAASKHIRVLERAGLLRQQKRGRVRHCELTPAPLDESQAWIAETRHFWEQQLDALGVFLANTADQTAKEEDK